MQQPITFVVSVSNREVLKNNFLASPCFRAGHSHQIILQEGYSSAAKAYNDAIDESRNNLIVFVHQDVIFLEPWLSQFYRALTLLESQDPNWGVLGCGGMGHDGHGRGHLYSSGLGTLGEPFEAPVQVRTLDEIVLILRKESGLRFDGGLPHFHLYGTDICLRAEAAHQTNYVIPAFCIHNTNYGLILAPEFYQCCQRIRTVWKDFLPVQTPCIRITRFNVSIYRRRLHELYLKYLRRKKLQPSRVDDVPHLIGTFSAQRHQSL